MCVLALPFEIRISEQRHSSPRDHVILADRRITTSGIDCYYYCSVPMTFSSHPKTLVVMISLICADQAGLLKFPSAGAGTIEHLTGVLETPTQPGQTVEKAK